VLRSVATGRRGVHPEIWARWGEIVGAEVGRRTAPRSLRGGTLTVAVGSSAWMQEISYLETRLLDRLAEEVGAGAVSAIRLVLDPEVGRRGGGGSGLGEGSTERREVSLPPDVAAAVGRVADDDLRSAVARAAAATLPDSDPD